MKIVQVTPRYPPRTGGVEKHVKEISERLVERGHDVTVLTADAGADVENYEVRNGVEVRRYRGFALGGAFHAAPSIALTVRRIDADVIHAHNYHSLPILFAGLGVQDEQFVVTPHYHGGSASSFRDRLLSLYRPLGKWALRRADEVTAVSEREREQLRADFGVGARVIPNGIERERFVSATSEERDRPYLLCVGRLEEYKGVQYAIHALREMPERELVVAGSGPYRSELEAIAEQSGVADRVSFLGYVEEERLPGLYAGAEAFLALSYFEAYGMTVAESLTSGTPVVVRKAGALVDWLNVPGVVGVSDMSSETLASAVSDVTCFESPDSNSVLSWETVIDQTVALYEA
ncbi:glycosyltransferase family 1 protein [halophilic archaeon]|nr:glycosyltransferase family 1 protein [halophilic archaeon]